MKDFDAMVLSVVRARARAGAAPRRPIRLVFTADEEAGSGLGAHWLVDQHPETVAGCEQAIGEVGGFSLTVRDDLRLYLVQTAEKGLAWLNLIADGRAGHGSFRNDDNAVTALAAAVARIGDAHLAAPDHRGPAGVPGGGLGGVRGRAGPGHGRGDAGPARQHRPDGRRDDVATRPTRRCSSAGYKHNVIPGRATAAIDGRFVPGGEEEFFETITELIGDRVRYEVVDPPAVGRDRVLRRAGRGDAVLPGRGGPGRPGRARS